MLGASITQALSLKNEGNYSEAASLLESIFTQDDMTVDPYTISSLVYCYSKTDQHNKIIAFQETLEKNGVCNEQVKIAAAWAIYHLHFKNLKLMPAETALELIERIKQLFPQIQSLHPLPLAVMKYISSINDTSSAFKLNLLNLVNPELLDPNPKHFAGKAQPFSSDKELFLNHYSKALFCESDFQRCADVCQQALSLNLTQKIWFERRYAMCLAKTGRMEEAFALYQKIAAQKGEWYIYYETALAAFRLQDLSKAELYAHQALAAPGKIETKIHLWELLRDIMLHNNSFEPATELLTLIAAIKHQMHWTISSELQKELESYNISLERLPSFKDIHRSIRSKLSDQTESKSSNPGTISKLLPGAVAGFITSGSFSYYFRSSDCHGFTPVLNAQVSFDLVDSFDIKKQQKTQRAVRIRLIS
ncbi:MAG TPA: hypothetical protein PL188_08165 [Candidatus Cloacimonadota bacterium]|nr:hypothetical protein [Candidatus Cloacimonadota bacterium]